MMTFVDLAVDTVYELLGLPEHEDVASTGDWGRTSQPLQTSPTSRKRSKKGG